MAGLNVTHQQGPGGSQKLHHSSSSNSKAAGLAASKVIYKRRRTSKSVPTMILETSCTEFRDAVQKLTGFQRPASATSSKKQPKCTSNVNPMPSYAEDEDHLRQLDYEDDAEVAPHIHSSPQSVLSDPSPELADAESFHHFLRSNMDSAIPLKHDDRSKYDASMPSLRGARFPSYANMPPRGAYPPPSGLLGHPGLATMPLLWEGIGGDHFLNSLSKLQDPTLAPNPYLIALENQLLAKFARRMQYAASNPAALDPWYQMGHMAPMRA